MAVRKPVSLAGRLSHEVCSRGNAQNKLYRQQPRLFCDSRAGSLSNLLIR